MWSTLTPIISTVKLESTSLSTAAIEEGAISMQLINRVDLIDVQGEICLATFFVAELIQDF